MEKVDAASGSFQGHLFFPFCFRVTRECTEVGTAYLRTFSGFTHSYKMFLEYLGGNLVLQGKQKLLKFMNFYR